MSSALAELLGESLVHRDGTTSPATSALAGLDYVLLYFSASWCPPCKRFTPMLGDYLKAHGAAKRFGVVFVSGDRDPASFEAYFAHHAWDLAVPYTASRTIAALNQSACARGGSGEGRVGAVGGVAPCQGDEPPTRTLTPPPSRNHPTPTHIPPAQSTKSRASRR